MSESENARRLQSLMMADLGSARREMITTSDEHRQAQVRIGAIESRRQIAPQDQAQLNKWANLHKEVRDTGGMEGLHDIAAGQSHRANLHAMLHPNGTQPKAYINLPMNAPLRVAVVALRGREDVLTFLPLRLYGMLVPHLLLKAGKNTAYKINCRAFSIVKGRPGGAGQHARSATVSPGRGLDPALSRNIDDGDARDRGRGRSRARGRGRGRAHEPIHKEPTPVVPPRAKRPPPSIDFSQRITQPADFMSIVRRVTEPPKSPTQKSNPAQGPVLSGMPEAKVPLSDNKEKKPEKAANLPPKPSVPPVEVSTRPSRADSVEKKASTKGTNVQATKSKTPGPHIGPYPVQTPRSPPSAPVAKGPVSNKPSKAIAAALSPPQQKALGVPVEQLPWKVSPNEEPRKQAGLTPSKKPPPVASGPPAKVSKQIIPASNQKMKGKQSAPPEPLPTVGPSSAGVATVGEGPATSPHSKAKAKATIAQADTVGNMKPFGTSVDPAAAGVAKRKQTAPPQHLLDMDPPSTRFPTIGEIPVTPTRSEAKAIDSPGAAELAGLKFMDRPAETKPARTIDEVISTNLMDRPAVLTPMAQSTSKENVDTYGPQILEELRNLGKVMRPPGTHDVEKIVELKLREMIANEPLVASWAAKRDIVPFEQHRSPPPPSSFGSIMSPPSAEKGQIWDELRDLSKVTRPPGAHDIEKLVESKLRDMMANEPLVTSWAAKRDITPFERHRSPPPPSSSGSNSSRSAEKHQSKPRVPGLSPTRSEDSDIITRLETLQVSGKLAAPLQPQRATNTAPVPSPKPIDVSKRPPTFDAAPPRPREEISKKSLPLHSSIHAGPAPSSTVSGSPKASTNVTHAGRSRASTQTLSPDHPNVRKQQVDKPHGVRVIGPAPYMPTGSLENQPSQQGRIFSMPDFAPLAQPKGQPFSMPDFAPIAQPKGEPRASLENQAPQQARQSFSMPDFAPVAQPKVKTRLPPFEPRK
ncbi:uncharacterized protein N7515_002765 [Penicillium bovifimosum]|uniref:Uncharacterized protein n=1 Tax=Penicillium bovifimosum TaxID=126998 RepID=A0A9W9HEI1_9EURO|nr:uncharacterized protein N7515_002765 [Penicillium bovifimosum]KAJ5143978.1 hypothetical protein N7515_002765 [Penicillium bovifimosum]